MCMCLTKKVLMKCCLWKSARTALGSLCVDSSLKTLQSLQLHTDIRQFVTVKKCLLFTFSTIQCYKKLRKCLLCFCLNKGTCLLFYAVTWCLRYITIYDLVTNSVKSSARGWQVFLMMVIRFHYTKNSQLQMQWCQNVKQFLRNFEKHLFTSVLFICWHSLVVFLMLGFAFGQAEFTVRIFCSHP